MDETLNIKLKRKPQRNRRKQVNQQVNLQNRQTILILHHQNRHEPIRITMVLLLLFGTVTMVGELEIPELAVCKLKVLMPIEFKVS